MILGLHSGETLPSQHLRAGNIHKAVGRLGLMILMIPPDVMALLHFTQHVGKSGLIASHAVEVLLFREDASSTDDLPAIAAG